MIHYNDLVASITCDKCGKIEVAPKAEYNERFYASGWTLNPRAKKFIHRCHDCLSPKEKKAQEFVKEKFPTP